MGSVARIRILSDAHPIIWGFEPRKGKKMEVEIGVFGYGGEQFSVTARAVRGTNKPSFRQDRGDGWKLITGDDPRGGRFCPTLHDCITRAQDLEGMEVSPDAEKKAESEWEDLKKSHLLAITGADGGVVRDDQNNLILMRWGWMKGIPFIASPSELDPSDVNREQVLESVEVDLDDAAIRMLNPEGFIPIEYFHTYNVWTACEDVEVTVCTGPTPTT